MTYFQRVNMSLRVIITELERPSLSLSAMARHRNLDCIRYDKCLDKVVKKNWRSFSCVKCPIFKIYLEEMKKFKEEKRSLIQGGVIYEEGFV